MDNKKKYLALVEQDFQLTDEVRTYFSSQDIDLVRYLPQLGILILESSLHLVADDLEYIGYIEPEKEMYALNEEE